MGCADVWNIAIVSEKWVEFTDEPQNPLSYDMYDAASRGIWGWLVYLKKFCAFPLRRRLSCVCSIFMFLFTVFC